MVLHAVDSFSIYIYIYIVGMTCTAAWVLFSSFLWRLLLPLLFNSPSTLCRLGCHGIWTRYPPFLHRNKEPLLHYLTWNTLHSGLLFFTFHILVRPPHHPIIPWNTIRPSVHLVYWPAGQLLCKCGLPYLNVLLYQTDTRGLQCIRHQGLLPLSFLCNPSRHSWDPPGHPMMETLQYFQHSSRHHPNLSPIY